MANTYTTIGRSRLNFPDLGNDGGLQLETDVKALFSSLSDDLISRHQEYTAISDSTKVELNHNLGVSIDELKILIYTGTGTDLTRVEGAALSDWVINAKAGSLKTILEITTPATGGPHSFNVIICHGSFIESIDELDDVDISTTSPEEGQALVWETNKFVPGASGDSSFKFQSVSGTNLTIKQGFLILSDGKELRLSSDLTYDLSSITVDGDYYGYIDLLSLQSSSKVNGREIYEISDSNIIFSEITPEEINLSRYVPLGCVQRSASVWQNQSTLAVRRHDIALGSDASLEFIRELNNVGAVGDVNQIYAGHELTRDSFSSNVQVAIFNLNDETSIGDISTALNNNGSIPFTGVGIEGIANTCPTFDGVSQFFSTANISFNPGDSGFSVGGWFYSADWQSVAVEDLFGQYNGSGNYSFIVKRNGSALRLIGSTDGTAIEILDVPHNIIGSGWNHIAITYNSTANEIELYLNATIIDILSLSAGLFQPGASRLFTIGASESSNYFTGKIDEFFFVTNSRLTSGDIRKVYSAKISHNKVMTPQHQKWFAWTYSGNKTLPYDGFITDITLNDLYVVFDNFQTNDKVELKLYNGSSFGLSKSSKGKTIQTTASSLDSLLPLSHNLGVIPDLSLKVWNGSAWEYADIGSIFVSTDTSINLAGDSLTTLFGGTTQLIFTYGSGSSTQFIPNKFWDSYVASTSIPVSVNDKILADSSGGTIALTLPGSPQIGDELQILDFNGSWSTTNRVDVLGNGKTIMGAATYELTVANTSVRIVYNGTEWRVF